MHFEFVLPKSVTPAETRGCFHVSDVINLAGCTCMYASICEHLQCLCRLSPYLVPEIMMIMIIAPAGQWTVVGNVTAPLAKHFQTSSFTLSPKGFNSFIDFLISFKQRMTLPENGPKPLRLMKRKKYGKK